MQPIDVVTEQMAGWYGVNSPWATLKGAMMFNISNVESYSNQFREDGALHEISFAVPPWPFVYAEGKTFKGSKLIFVVRTTEMPKDDARAWKIEAHVFSASNKKVGLKFRSTIHLTRSGAISETEDWETVWNHDWIKAKDFKLELVALFEDMRRQGREIAQRLNQEPTLVTRLVPIIPDNVQQFIDVEIPDSIEKWTDQHDREMTTNLPNRCMMVFFLATMLANCKNVVTSSEAVPPKIVRARKRKDRIPVERWYTLRIEPMQKKIRHTGIEGGDLPNADNHLTYERAWHICRGHFKEFKPERPLFGRVTGRFWWPSMVRGSKDKGIVHKDYELGDATESTTEGTTSQRSTVAQDEPARSAQIQAHEADASHVELADDARTKIAD